MTLGAVSFEEGLVLGGGQVPVPMFVRVSQSAFECCSECGQMPSWLAIEPKRGLFRNSMQINICSFSMFQLHFLAGHCNVCEFYGEENSKWLFFLE